MHSVDRQGVVVHSFFPFLFPSPFSFLSLSMFLSLREWMSTIREDGAWSVVHDCLWRGGWSTSLVKKEKKEDEWWWLLYLLFFFLFLSFLYTFFTLFFLFYFFLNPLFSFKKICPSFFSLQKSLLHNFHSPIYTT